MSEMRLRSQALEWREIDGEVVALEAEASVYLAANSSATLLWRRLAEGTTRSELCDVLESAYSIAREVAARDVDAFLGEARHLGLLEGT